MEDRQTLCQRNATSKIENFCDIEGIRTYGFRGEALASLCNIGEVTLITKVEGEVMARKYELNHDGTIVS